MIAKERYIFVLFFSGGGGGGGGLSGYAHANMYMYM